MLKTGAVSTIKLVELLDEAVERAETAMAERQVDLDPSERAHVARLLGNRPPSSTPTLDRPDP